MHDEPAAMTITDDDPDIVSALRAQAGRWCFTFEGEDGNDWTQGSFLPTDAADEIERLRDCLRKAVKEGAELRDYAANPTGKDFDAYVDAWMEVTLEAQRLLP